MSPLQRLSAAALVPVATLALASAASAATPSQSTPTESGTKTTKTRICVVKKTKRARVVRVTEHCRRHETRMSWRKYEQFATNSAASGSDDAAIGVPGPQGLTGDQGPQGPAGPQGATGAKGATGETGPAGPQGEKGDTGAQGAAGPSDIYTTTGTSGVTSTSDDTRATLNLPAGSYLLLGQARAVSSDTVSLSFVRCRIRSGATPLTETGTTVEQAFDHDSDGATAPVAEANMLMVSPLVTGGATVTLSCRGFLGLPLVDNVQLTAIKTGALHT